jgi:LysR family transcriptional regulator, low CO2-responsive transcriptional regulator
MLLGRIELFVAVAKHQNLGKAARERHVSASSVCQRLKFLEDDFGVKLYKKNKGGIELTGAGQSLLRTASEVLNQLQTLKKTLNHNSETTVQSLTIGGNRNPSTKYLPSAIAAFQKTHPDVKGTLLTSDRASIEKLLRGSEVDIALIQSPSKSSDFNLEPFAVDHSFDAPTSKKETIGFGRPCTSFCNRYGGKGFNRESAQTARRLRFNTQCRVAVHLSRRG